MRSMGFLEMSLTYFPSKISLDFIKATTFYLFSNLVSRLANSLTY